MNTSKSEALSLNINPSHLNMLKANLPYNWRPDAVKYLGVYLTPQYGSLYHANYPPFFREIHDLLSDLFFWQNNLGEDVHSAKASLSV